MKYDDTAKWIKKEFSNRTTIKEVLNKHSEIQQSINELLIDKTNAIVNNQIMLIGTIGKKNNE